MRTRKPVAIDCFAGAGGMSEGLRQAGFRVVAAVEIDEAAAAVYAANHKRVNVVLKDIAQVSAQSLMELTGLKKGELDLLGGCPPCQGFSSLRTHNGGRRVRDRRNDLIFEYQRLVTELRPRYVMLENVPRLFRDWRFKEFRRALEADGYHVRAEVVDVARYGVPQRRRRTVLVASRVGEPKLPNVSKRTYTVRDAIGSLPRAGFSGDVLHDLPEQRSKLVMKRIRQIPKDGGGRSDLPRSLTLKCHRIQGGFTDVYGRMAWDRVAPTITTGCFNPSKGRFLHPVENRAVTLREAALLQSFPPEYRFPVSFGKVKLAEMIGNALPPAFIKAHAIALRGGRQ